MKNIINILLCIFLIDTACNQQIERLELSETIGNLSVNEFLQDLNNLSSNEMMGRKTGSPGYDSAANYILKKIKSLGLKPGGTNGAYFQPIKFKKSSIERSSLNLKINGEVLEFGKDYSIAPRTSNKEIDINTTIVFMGFGICAPELNYDDFADIDVTGKVVMIIRDAPSNFGLVERAVLTNESTITKTLKEKGALGVISVFPESLDQITPWKFISASVSSPLLRWINPENVEDDEIQVALALNRKKAVELFKKAAQDYKNVVEQLVNGNPVSFDMGINVQIKAKFNSETTQSHNVAGILEGTDPKLKGEYLIMTAHLDHLGIGYPIEKDSIYNGTLDNASGSSALLTLANTFSKMKAPKRSIMFLWLTGEEQGLLGSEYFAKYPTINSNNVVANQNMDAIVGLIVETKDVIAYGYEHSNLSKSVDYATKYLGLKIGKDPAPEQNFFARSDHYSFVKEGYPAVWAVSGRIAENDSINAQMKIDNWIGQRYHKPSDDMTQTMDLKGIKKELELNFLIAYHIINKLETVKWNEDSFLFNRFVR